MAVLSAAAVHAETINIPDDYDTIQAGIDASSDADTVLVQPGTYYENINFNGKNIVLGSLFITTQDTSYISKTVIDGDKKGSVVTFESGEDSTTVLGGLTLVNGSGESDGLFKNGGGIYCYSSNPLLKNLIIYDNSSNYGGGIYCEICTIDIKNVKIFNNYTSLAGGGIFCERTNLIIRNSSIYDNESHGGGGIFCALSDIVIYNTLIYRNLSNLGGAISTLKSNLDLIGVTIYRNDSNDSGIRSSESKIIIVNSILWKNQKLELSASKKEDRKSTFIIAYSDVKGGKERIDAEQDMIIWLEKNIDDDPQLVDPETGNLRLQKGSPCIDTGTSFFQFGDSTIVDLDSADFNGIAPDLGAYEHEGNITDVYENMAFIHKGFTLFQNYPNPFNSVTTISFSLPTSSHVILKVYNTIGEEVSTLKNDFLTSGNYRINWDANNFSTGIYFYKINIESFNDAKKLLIVK